MPYLTSNQPQVIGGGGVGGILPTFWFYSSTDSSATIAATAGYFTNARSLGIAAGDYIIVVDTSTTAPTTSIHVAVAYNGTALTTQDINASQNSYVDVVIANAAQESGVISCNGKTLVGIIMPAAFTGGTIQFLAAPTLGGTYQTVYQTNGNALEATVAASRTILFGGDDLAALDFIKLKSSSAEGAARTITVILR